MGWLDVFRNCQSKLKEICKSVAGVQAVYITRTVSPKAFPCIYVLSEEVVEDRASTVSAMLRLRFTIQIVAQNEELDIVDSVRSNLVSDRTLGGIVDNLEIIRIEPEVELPRVTARFIHSMTIELFKQLFDQA